MGDYKSNRTPAPPKVLYPVHTPLDEILSDIPIVPLIGTAFLSYILR